MKKIIAEYKRMKPIVGSTAAFILAICPQIH